MAVVYVLMYFKCKISFTVYTGETKINDTYLLTSLLTYLLTYVFKVSVFFETVNCNVDMGKIVSCIA